MPALTEDPNRLATGRADPQGSNISPRLAVINRPSFKLPTPMMAMEDNESAVRAEQSGKRRSTLHIGTSKWSLGKTIGVGSASKVKLAKNLETGEQVL
jgi:hypothetical protein